MQDATPTREAPPRPQAGPVADAHRSTVSAPAGDASQAASPEETKNEGRLALFSRRLAAAKKTRSRSSSRGRATCRRRTASSWRSTTISSSLNSRDRKRSAATASTRRKSRYSNDGTKQRLPHPDTPESRLYGAESSNTPLGPRTRFTHPTGRSVDADEQRTRISDSAREAAWAAPDHECAAECGFESDLPFTVLDTPLARA